MKMSTKGPNEDYARMSCQLKERPQLVYQKRISNRFVHLPWCALSSLFLGLQAWYSLWLGRLCIFLLFFFCFFSFFFFDFFYFFSLAMLLCQLLYLASHSHFPKASAQCLDKHKMSCSHRIDTHKGRYGAVKVAQVIPLVLLRTCNRWWWMMFECRGVDERGRLGCGSLS